MTVPSWQADALHERLRTTCWPFFHDWSKWEPKRDTDTEEIWQERRCRRCGKIQQESLLYLGCKQDYAL